MFYFMYYASMYADSYETVTYIYPLSGGGYSSYDYSTGSTATGYDDGIDYLGLVGGYPTYETDAGTTITLNNLAQETVLPSGENLEKTIAIIDEIAAESGEDSYVISGGAEVGLHGATSAHDDNNAFDLSTTGNDDGLDAGNTQANQDLITDALANLSASERHTYVIYEEGDPNDTADNHYHFQDTTDGFAAGANPADYLVSTAIQSGEIQEGGQTTP
jgi:hypothetical protein